MEPLKIDNFKEKIKKAFIEEFADQYPFPNVYSDLVSSFLIDCFVSFNKTSFHTNELKIMVDKDILLPEDIPEEDLKQIMEETYDN